MSIRRKNRRAFTEIEEDPRLAADEEAPKPEEKRGGRFFSYTYAGIAIIGLVLVSRLFYLSVVEGSKNITRAEGNRVKELVLRAPRGLILDRNGRMLAENQANFELTVIPGNLPREEGERSKEYALLAKLLNRSESDLRALAEAKGLDFYQAILISERLPRNTALNVEANFNSLPGVHVQVNPIRQYAKGTAFSHILGYVGRINEEELAARPDYFLTDFMGKEGIEKQYESLLRGTNGARVVEVDALGRIVRSIGPPREPVAGKTIYLTIDSKLQQFAEKALKDGMKRAKTKKGSIVVMDPNTGDVLAAVSAPGYDNNLFAKGISAKQYSRLINNPNQPLFFRAVDGTYPSGSVIKPFIASAGLQEGIVNENTTVSSTGGVQINKQLYPDWQPGGHGATSVKKAIAQSVNTYFYLLGGGLWNREGTEVIKPGLGVKRIKKYLNLFGFGVKSGIDLPTEPTGLVPDPQWKLDNKPRDCTKGATAIECWYLGDTYNLSIGQGDISVSPLQMASGLSVIANGGKYITPHFFRGEGNEQGKVSVTQSKVVRSGFVSASNLAIIREGMRMTVTSGSGQLLNDLKVPVAGKTGTAQFGVKNLNENAWFVSFAPYNKPSIVVVVLMDGAGQGHAFAAPVAKEIYKYYFK